MKNKMSTFFLMLLILGSCKKTEHNATTNNSKKDTVSVLNTAQIDNSNSDSVNLLKLQTECDCIDAGLIVASELISYDNKKLTSVQQDRVKELKIKLKKIIDLSYELASSTGFEKHKDGLRKKWSFHSCKNYDKFYRISPIKEALVADTTSIKIIEN